MTTASGNRSGRFTSPFLRFTFSLGFHWSRIFSSPALYRAAASRSSLPVLAVSSSPIRAFSACVFSLACRRGADLSFRPPESAASRWEAAKSALISLKNPSNASQSITACATGMTVVSLVLYSAYSFILGASIVPPIESISTSTGLSESKPTAANSTGSFESTLPASSWMDEALRAAFSGVAISKSTLSVVRSIRAQLTLGLDGLGFGSWSVAWVLGRSATIESIA